MYHCSIKDFTSLYQWNFNTLFSGVIPVILLPTIRMSVVLKNEGEFNALRQANRVPEWEVSVCSQSFEYLHTVH